MTRPIVLWGATGQTRVLAEFLPALGFQLAALFDNDLTAVSPVPEAPLHHGRDGFLRWRTANPLPVAGIIAIGGQRGADRLDIQAFLSAQGVEIATAIHPRAFVAANARLAAGCQVLAQAVVAADATLGLACIVNHNATVDHECRLEEGVHIAAGATLCGLVSIGTNSLIGAGATVLPRLRIGSNTVVGAGAVVTKNLPDNVVVYGNPARIIRANSP